MSKKTIIILAVVVIIGAFVAWYFAAGGKEKLMSTDAKRKALLNEVTEPAAADAFNRMTPDEISASYTAVFDYVKKGKDGFPAKLAEKINAISAKYNIFT